MAIQENNISYTNCLNGDSGQIELEKRIEIIKLDISNPAVVMKDAQKFSISLSNVISGTMADWVFTLDNQTLAIKVFASVSALKDYTLAGNEIAYIGGDVNLRNVIWLHIKNLGKTLNCEYLTECSVLNAFNMNEIAKKLNALKPDEIESNITNLKARMQLAENDLDVLDVDLRELEEKVNSLNERLTDTESKITIAEGNINSLNSSVDTLKSDVVALKDKTSGLSRTDTTTTITDSLKASGTLEVIGKSTMNDIEVKGNIEVADTSVISGVLKDDKGFKYVKVRTGSIANSIFYEDVKVELREEGMLTITGLYLETASQSVEGGEAHTKLNQSTPSNIVFLNLDFIIFNAVSTPLNFLAFGNPAIPTNTSKFNIAYKNLTNVSENINGWQGRFIITGKIEPTKLNGIVQWDA